MLLLAEGQLKPKQVDLSRTVNRHAHHTSNYEIPNLVLRRGQAFEMVITFERAFSPNEDSIVLKFVTGQPLFALKVRTLKLVTGQLLFALKVRTLKFVTGQLFFILKVRTVKFVTGQLLLHRPRVRHRSTSFRP